MALAKGTDRSTSCQRQTLSPARLTSQLRKSLGVSPTTREPFRQHLLTEHLLCAGTGDTAVGDEANVLALWRSGQGRREASSREEVLGGCRGGGKEAIVGAGKDVGGRRQGSWEGAKGKLGGSV